MRYFLLILCSIVLLTACGSDEIPEPAETKPNYFPDAIGSRWVYRNSEGLQWVWLVNGEKTINEKNYFVFDDTPAISDAEFDFLKPTNFRSTQDQVFFAIGDKIERYIQTELLTLVQDEFAGLEVKIDVDPISYPELFFFQIPLTLNSQWDALNVNVSGNFILQDLILLNIPFEVHLKVKGEVIGKEVLGTPAETFENTFKIKYTTEITHITFDNEEVTKRNQTIWFVPHVGIVKIEDEHGVTELIEYSLVSKIEEKSVK